MPDLIGQTIHHYQLERLLGQGALGRVYQAHDLAQARTVALKVIHAPLASDSGFRQQFLTHLRRATSLDHPALACLLAVEYQDDYLFTVSEFVAGENLRAILNHADSQHVPLAYDVIVTVATQLVECLSYIHSKGFLHGGLKPRQIFFRQTGFDPSPATLQIALTDWGLMQASARATTAPASADFPYMSLEQFGGTVNDPRIDLYALGVILYELVTGRPPIQLRSIQEVVQFHQSGVVTRPSLLREGIPAFLEASIMKALARPASAGYQDAEAFRRDLRQQPTIMQARTKMEVPVMVEGDNEKWDTEPQLQPPLSVPPLVLAPASAPPASADPVSAAPDPAPAPAAPGSAFAPPAPALLQTIVQAPPAAREPIAAQPVVSPVLDAPHQPVEDDTLVIRQSRPSSERRLSLSQPVYIVGRDDDCDITLDHHRLSRKHLRLECLPQRAYQVTDLRSTNGVWLDNVRLAPETPTLWQPASILRIGDFWLTIEPGKTLAQVDTDHGHAPLVDVPAAPVLDMLMIPQEITVAPGGMGSIQLDIINRASTFDHFSLRLSGLPEQWYRLPTYSIHVEAEDKTSAPLIFCPPRHNSTRAGIYTFNLVVSSLNHPGQSMQAQGQLRLTDFSDFTVDLQPRRGASEQPFYLTITNLGNRPAYYRVAADAYQEQVIFQLPGDMLAVNPGQAVPVPVRVAARSRPLLFGSSRLPFTLIVSDDEAVERQQSAELIAPPAIPAYCFAFAALGMLMLCGLLALLGYTRQIAIQQQQATATHEAIIALQATEAAGDADGDGLSNAAERNDTATNPDLPDTDDDGLTDGAEVDTYLTNPLNPDSDSDGLSDGYEITVSQSDPNNPDTDGDSTPDGADSDPLLALNPARPDEFVRLYYQQVMERRYELTWPQLTPHFRISTGTHTRDLYDAWWNRVAQIAVGQVYTITETAEDACVFVELTYTFTDGSQFVDDLPVVLLLRDPTTDGWLINGKIADH
jgi:serine/threonine protein kinase